MMQRLGVLTALLVATGVVHAAPASKESSPSVDLPIREVTVFSDRARVTRAGDVRLARGTSRITLPVLPSTVDDRSVRLESKCARVLRVEVSSTQAGSFPRAEAEALLGLIERLRDEERAAAGRISILEEELRALQSVRPGSTPTHETAPLLLEPAGWKAGLDFFDVREASIATELGNLEMKQRSTRRELDEAITRARQMAAGVHAQPGVQVEAIVEGSGRAELSLTYMARNARWYPSYDVRYLAGESHVDVELSALVSQETGEDWLDARLEVSTATPIVTAELPQLAVWKIGDRERFIPTPQAQPQPRTSRPQPVPPPARSENADEPLRTRLLAATSGAEAARGDHLRSREPPPPPGRPPAPARQEAPRRKSLATFGDAPSADVMMEATTSRTKEAAAEAVSFGAPAGWRPPRYDPNLPAQLAGGYEFVYAAARPESVASGGESRRVALHSVRLPAEPIVRIYPALSPFAFLTAQVTNGSDRPLLRGKANLFVGADLVGEAELPNTAVGTSTALPLGVDEAIRIERRVDVLASQKGVFSKKDVNDYRVDIELLNPRAKPVQALVFDQVPLPQAQNVEIALVSSEPVASADEAEGFLEWKAELPPGQKRVITFTYSVSRPRGAKLWQRTARQGSR